jgi:hypothetical protein
MNKKAAVVNHNHEHKPVHPFAVIDIGTTSTTWLLPVLRFFPRGRSSAARLLHIPGMTFFSL